MASDYYRRHYAVNKLYTGIDKDGRTKSVMAYNKKEATQDLRKSGFRPVRVVQS